MFNSLKLLSKLILILTFLWINSCLTGFVLCKEVDGNIQVELSHDGEVNHSMMHTTSHDESKGFSNFKNEKCNDYSLISDFNLVKYRSTIFAKIFFEYVLVKIYIPKIFQTCLLKKMHDIPILAKPLHIDSIILLT